MSSIALAISGGALAIASLLLKRASERDTELLREMYVRSRVLIFFTAHNVLPRDGLSPVNLQQIRAAAALGSRQLFQGQVDASEGLQPFELQGSKRKSTLAYTRHVVKYQVRLASACSCRFLPCCLPAKLPAAAPQPPPLTHFTDHAQSTAAAQGC